MKLVNIVTGVLRDINTGEVTQAFEEKNHIQKRYIDATVKDLYHNTSLQSLGNGIFVSEANPKKQRRDWDLCGLGCSLGINISGVTSPEYSYFTADDLHLKELSQRFNPPSQDRSIYTIGLTRSTDDVVTLGNGIVDAVVNLTVPCTQTTTQTLDIFYRVQVIYDVNYWDTIRLNTDNVLTPSESYNIAKVIFGQLSIANTLNPSDVMSTNFSYKMNPRRIKRYNPMVDWDVSSVPPTVSNVGLSSQDFLRNSLKYSIELSNKIGLLIGTSLYGEVGALSPYNGLMFAHNLIPDKSLSPLQSVFGHSALATKPFFDANTVQTGLGTLSVNADSWIDTDYPKIQRINITTTGALGVSEYKIQQRNMFGFLGNNFDNKFETLIGFGADNSHYTEGFKICRGDYSYTGSTNYTTKKISKVLPYKQGHIVTGWIDELCIADVSSQAGKRFAVDTTPALGVTNITQFTVENSSKDVWVACRDTGLYRISEDQTTVNKFDSTSNGLTGVIGCYGVTVGASNRIWAFFNGSTPGMYYTDDIGVNWVNVAFSFPAIDANYNVVRHIHADPANVDNQIAIGYSDTKDADEENIYIAWWDGALVTAVAGVAVQGPLVVVVANNGVLNPLTSNQNTYGSFVEYTIPVTYFNSFGCSPNDSFWVAKKPITYATLGTSKPIKLIFGSSNTIAMPGTDISTNNAFSGNFGIDDNGNDAYFYVTAAGQGDTYNTDTYSVLLVMFKSDLTHNSCLVRLDGSFRVGYLFRDSVAYLGNGVMLVQDEAINSVTANTNSTYLQSVRIIALNDATGDKPEFNNEMYPEYGWDGSNWVQGHAGSKPTHATTEVLLDGVTVNFDDAGGANTFNDTEYYSYGLHYGVLLDGATTLEPQWDWWMLPSYKETDVEQATLIASNRVPPNIGVFEVQSIADFQDVTGVEFSTSTNRPLTRTSANTIGNLDAGCRSLTPAINNLTTYEPSASKLTMYDQDNVFGYFESTCNRSTWDQHIVFGLSLSSVLGQAISPDTIKFAFELDDSNNLGDVITTLNIRVDNVIVATVPNFDSPGSLSDYFRIIILYDGTVIFEVNGDGVGQQHMEVYKSASGTAPIEDYYFDCAMSGYQYTGIERIKYYSHVNADRYMYLGNGTDTGVFHEDFYAIDPKYCKIFIDGVEAVNIGDTDTDSVLIANTYSLFPFSGTIRYSSADDGKTITAEYSTLAYV